MLLKGLLQLHIMKNSGHSTEKTFEGIYLLMIQDKRLENVRDLFLFDQIAKYEAEAEPHVSKFLKLFKAFGIAIFK